MHRLVAMIIHCARGGGSSFLLLINVRLTYVPLNNSVWNMDSSGSVLFETPLLCTYKVHNRKYCYCLLAVIFGFCIGWVVTQHVENWSFSVVLQSLLKANESLWDIEAALQVQWFHEVESS